MYDETPAQRGGGRGGQHSRPTSRGSAAASPALRAFQYVLAISELGAETFIPPRQLAAEEPAAKEVPPTWAQMLDISFPPAIKEGVITPPGGW